jgi:hypothetical protein
MDQNWSQPLTLKQPYLTFYPQQFRNYRNHQKDVSNVHCTGLLNRCKHQQLQRWLISNCSGGSLLPRPPRPLAVGKLRAYLKNLQAAPENRTRDH